MLYYRALTLIFDQFAKLRTQANLIDSNVMSILQQMSSYENFHRIMDMSGGTLTPDEVQASLQRSLNEFNRINRSHPESCDPDLVEAQNRVIQASQDSVKVILRGLIGDFISGSASPGANMDALMDQVKAQILPHVIRSLAGPSGSSTPLARELYVAIAGKVIHETTSFGVSADWYYGERTAATGYIHNTYRITDAQLNRALLETAPGRRGLEIALDEIVRPIGVPGSDVDFNAVVPRIKQQVEAALDQEKAERNR